MARTMTNPRAAKTLPGKFADLVRAHPPMAMHDEVGYANAMEYIDALSDLPARSRGQLEYLDTLCVLVAAYEDQAHAIDTSHLSPLDL